MKNQEIIVFFLNNYIGIALTISLFYGGFAERIFGNEEQRKNSEKAFGFLGHLHQFWLNFIGQVAGWFSFYIFIKTLQVVGMEKIAFGHGLLLMIGIIGIMGWLPLTLTGVIQSLADIAKRLIDKL